MKRVMLSNIVPVLAAAVTLATPAAAQRAAARQTIVPEVAPVVRVRPVATYDLVETGDRRLPTRITVADSAGTLVASYRLPGDRTAYPMLVVVMGSDLVLQGETDAGVLTLELYGANGAGVEQGGVRGRWHLDGREGELGGR